MMHKYILSGKNMRTREDAHTEIARALDLPAHYGRNLDALWDELICMEGEILLENAGAIDGYGGKILALLWEAADQNPRLTLNIQA